MNPIRTCSFHSVRVAIFSAAFWALVMASLASAQPSGSIDSSLVGTFGQNLANITNNALPNPVATFQPFSVAIGPNACVPTSTNNGLTYLENYATQTLGIPNPFSVDPNSQAQINNVAGLQQTFNLTRTTGPVNGQFTDVGGTYTDLMFNGTRAWLNANNPAGNVTMSGEVAGGTPASWITGAYAPNTNVVAATPTASYLAGLLTPQNNAVELTIEWGSYNGGATWTSSGGHEVVLTSINMTSATSGTMGFMDPWGSDPNNPGNTAFLYQGAVFQANVSVQNGYLVVTYPTVLADFDRNTNPLGVVGADGSIGRIDVAMVESVPEPSTLLLAGTALVISAVCAWRRRRLFRAAGEPSNISE